MRDRLNDALSRLTSDGSAWRARAVDRVTSGTITTKARLTSRAKRTTWTPPRTIEAATKPPTIEAAALSGWPSMAVATDNGSLAPAAAAAATARAADEPRPRAMGMSERTVMARWSVPATSMATRAARWEESSASPSPSPTDRTISFEAGSTSTRTYRLRARPSVSNPGPRLADDAGTRARTAQTYPHRPCRTGTAGSGAGTAPRARGVLQPPPHGGLGHRLGQLQRHDLELRADGVDGRAHGRPGRAPRRHRDEPGHRLHLLSGPTGQPGCGGRGIRGRMGLA